MNIEWISLDLSTDNPALSTSSVDLTSISLRGMDQIFPSPVDDVDVGVLYRSDDRSTNRDLPWVMCNMISSADGGIAVDGVSGGLGGPEDKKIFGAIRALPDIIVVASGTVAAEDYRKPQTPTHTQRERALIGQAPIPRLAIVSGSLNLDPALRVFESDTNPLIFTTANAETERRKALADVAELITAGETSVDLEFVLRHLARSGAQVILVEGGPTLNGAFVDADLIDELCLSSSPLLLGGTSPRIVANSKRSTALRLRLDRTLHENSFLFHRYLRNR